MKKRISPNQEDIAEDLELVKSAISGNTNCFTKLYNKYILYAQNVAKVMCEDPYAREEVIQESFARAFAKINQWRGDAMFSSWLYLIIKNGFINRVRSKTHRIRFVELTTDTPIPSEADYNIFKREVESMVESLPSSYKLVAKSRWFVGKKHKEIALENGWLPASSRATEKKVRDIIGRKIAQHSTN